MVAPRHASKNSKHQSTIGTWNDEPKPFVWQKSADEILDTLAT
jgi:hypothetical protein